MQITSEPVNDASGTLVATNSGLWAKNGSAWIRVVSERVTLIAEDGWYATTRKLCRFVDGESNCPTTSDGESVSDAKTLYVDPVSHEVFVLDGNNNPLKYNAAIQHFVAGTDDKWFPDYLPTVVHDMVAQPAKWHYATDDGLYFVAFHSDETLNGIPGPDYGLSGGWPVSVYQMSVDPTTGTIWLATNQGAFHSNNELGWVFVAGLPSRNITTVLATSDAIWFGTADAGLIRFVPAKS
jgi:hypothetical protein